MRDYRQLDKHLPVDVNAWLHAPADPATDVVCLLRLRGREVKKVAIPSSSSLLPLSRQTFIAEDTMAIKSLLALASAAVLLAGPSTALTWPGPRPSTKQTARKFLDKRQYFPANATDVKTITSPTNVTIRYKMPGEAGICETTPGVNSYAGYIDMAPNGMFATALYIMPSPC